MMKDLSEHLEPPFDLDFYRSLKGKEAEAERLKGRQPVMDIKGQPYFVNLHLGLLEPPWSFDFKPIAISDLKKDSVTRKLCFYYDTETRLRVNVPHNITDLPKNVVRVIIPNQFFLDPVAMARINGRGAENYRHYGIPLRMYRKAVIVPLAKTELLAIVNKNRLLAGMEILPAVKPKLPIIKKRSKRI